MIHIEILIEDQSGKAAVEAILANLSPEFTYRVISYRGIGRIPKGLNPKADPSKRILLDRLPQLVGGYGKSFAADPADYTRYVFIICDLDDRDESTFRAEIQTVIDACHPLPRNVLCFSVEEGEAWLLGDMQAVSTAYPKANSAALASYVQDSICGTWERLADAIYPGGARALKKQHFSEIGTQKFTWAQNIAPLIDANRNISPSFQSFLTALRTVAEPT